MGLAVDAAEGRFRMYLAGLSSAIGHADRIAPLRDYCTGLLLPGERKSVEPMAALTAPSRTSAQHQSLLHFVGQASWSDERVLAKVREMVMPALERHGPIEAWILDDTGFPKKGRHSVGVARQYCGQRGKEDNCQVAVSLSLANRRASLPVAFRLYLPKVWADDAARRRQAGVPAQIVFRTKLEIALGQIRWACEAKLPRGAVLMDAGYGHDARLRTAVTALDLPYVAGIMGKALMWPPATRPCDGKSLSHRGRRAHPELISAKTLAFSLPAQAWSQVTWREGSAEPLASRFARVRVCVADRHKRKAELGEEWLLIEWPEGEKEPARYWLSTLPEDTTLPRLVDMTKLRWRIERDYQDLKQEVGLGHFEGRGWRGFHHHLTLCIAAYGFLISERETIPPSAHPPARGLSILDLPPDYRPRGSSAPHRTAHPKLDRHHAPPHRY